MGDDDKPNDMPSTADSQTGTCYRISVCEFSKFPKLCEKPDENKTWTATSNCFQGIRRSFCDLATQTLHIPAWTNSN